jgi:hypothetical protein
LGPRRLISVLTASGLACQGVPLRSADLQIDIQGADLVDTDRVRVCIEGLAVHEQALGDGRMALGALRTDKPLTVSVDVLDDNWSLGGIDPVTLDSVEPWISADWVACSHGCAPCTLGTNEPAPEDPDGQVLAIQFLNN